MALAERCLRKLQDGVKHIDGGSTDFWSYSFRISKNPDWIEPAKQQKSESFLKDAVDQLKKEKQLEFDFSKPIESKEIKVNTKRLTNLGLIK